MILQELFNSIRIQTRLDENRKRYEEMLQPLREFEKQIGATGSPIINSFMEKSRNLYGSKPDRLVWALRYFRIRYMHELLKNVPNYDFMEWRNLLDKYINEMQHRTGVKSSEQVISAARLVTWSTWYEAMEHYLHTPEWAPVVDQIEFGWRDPHNLRTSLENAVQEWKQEQSAFLSDLSENTGATAIIHFPDGFTWWNLHKAACGSEAAAMGHCGNSPRSHSNDTVLSLRKRVTRNGFPADKPFLTFILNEQGFLTEMKGRNNDKPVQRYHPYIVELLKHPIVKGIIGGGYMPENNFDISDLDPSVSAKLIKNKPKLGPIDHWFDWSQLNEEDINLIRSMAKDAGLFKHTPSYDKQWGFIIAEYPDKEALFSEIQGGNDYAEVYHDMSGLINDVIGLKITINELYHQIKEHTNAFIDYKPGEDVFWRKVFEKLSPDNIQVLSFLSGYLQHEPDRDELAEHVLTNGFWMYRKNETLEMHTRFEVSDKSEWEKYKNTLLRERDKILERGLDIITGAEIHPRNGGYIVTVHPTVVVDLMVQTRYNIDEEHMADYIIHHGWLICDNFITNIVELDGNSESYALEKVVEYMPDQILNPSVQKTANQLDVMLDWYTAKILDHSKMFAKWSSGETEGIDPVVVSEMSDLIRVE